MTWKNKNNPVECSLVEKKTINMTIKAQQKIEILLEAYPSSEWLAYLVGHCNTTKAVCGDIIVPPHKEANGACAEAEPLTVPDKCIGIIHSHHSMGTFRSGTDANYADMNHPFSLIVSKRGNGVEYGGVSCSKTPCDKIIVKECKVSLNTIKPDFDIETWLEKAKENIEKGKKKYFPLFPQDTHIGTQLGKELRQNAKAAYLSGYNNFMDWGDSIDNEGLLGKDGNVITKQELARHLEEIYGGD